MKLDDLIGKLKEIEELNGNIEVVTYDDVLENLTAYILCEVVNDIEFLDSDEHLVRGDVLCL